jgi:hypothetical protein
MKDIALYDLSIGSLFKEARMLSSTMSEKFMYMVEQENFSPGLFMFIALTITH